MIQRREVDLHIVDYLSSYFIRNCGWTREDAEERAQSDIRRELAVSALSLLDGLGIGLTGRTVLDLGAGVGALSLELALRGATVIAVEPDATRRALISARFRVAGATGIVLDAVGEAIPLHSESVDMILSLQVLEHVADPEQVLREAYRILRPGGLFYLSCENYLSFREPHYRVFWLPLFPKPIGALYLRLRGRSPDFLRTSVTYTTLPGVLRSVKRSGFITARDIRLQTIADSPCILDDGWKRAMLRVARVLLPGRVLFIMLRFIDIASRMFRAGVHEILYKAADRDPGAGHSDRAAEPSTRAGHQAINPYLTSGESIC